MTEDYDPIVLAEELMVDIDHGHSLLDASQNDLSAAMSIYCLNIIDASQLCMRYDTEFAKGMAEGFSRIVLGLTGLLAAYEDRTAYIDES